MMLISRRLSAAVILTCLCASAQDFSSLSTKEKVRSVRDLGKRGAEAIPQIAGALQDPEPDVRREAVRAITGIGTQHSLEPLIQATRDNDSHVQIRAVDGIVNYYLPGYVETGFSRLSSAVKGRFDRENTQVIDPYVKVSQDALRAVGKVASGGTSIEARASAARAIGILRGKAAIPDLIEAMQKTKDDKVLYESLIALQKIRDQSAGPKIMFLLKDPVERVQITALQTAGILNTKEAVPAIEGVFRDSRSDKVRKAALESLGMLANPGSRPLFKEGFDDRNDGVRAAAAEGYARLKDAEAKPMIAEAFPAERKMGPRLAQAFALVALGERETGELAPLTYLVNTLNSRSYRDVARPYLVELAREAPVREALYGYLRTGTRDEKVGLAHVLAASGDRASETHLEALTKDSDAEVAQEAIRALRNLRTRLG